MIMKCTKFNSYILVHPEDWKEITFDIPKTAQYAFAIEVRNGAKYNVPHFYCFSKKNVNELSPEDEAVIYNKCSMISEEFRLAMQHIVEPVFDPVTRYVLNAEEYMNGTTPGIFQIAQYGEDDDPPYGAVVIAEKNITIF